MKQSLYSVAVVLLFVWVFAGSAGAVSLEYYGIEDTINSDNSVDNSVVLQFKEPVGHLDYQLGFRIYNLTSDSDFPFAECASEDTEKGSIISCDFIGMTKNRNKLVLKFRTDEIVNKVDENYRFNVNYGVSVPVDRAFTLIKLPENGILSENVANQSFFPPDGGVLTDGWRIMVYWNKYNLTSGDDLRYGVLYTLPGSRDPAFSYVIIIMTIAVIAVMIGIAVYLKRGQKPARPGAVIESVLNRDEKAVVSILNNHDGKAGQKVLVRESDFSKAKVSRLVANLKERGVIDIEPISGRENRIMLKKEIKTSDEKTD